jgi:hypothetical protein
MRWLSLWLCVMLAGQHTLAQETLADDPRLQTRITVWLKMEPLRAIPCAPLANKQASPCAAKTPSSTTRSRCSWKTVLQGRF